MCYGPAAWSVRKVLACVRHLPDDAATVRAVTHGWTAAEELAAAQLELTHQQLSAFVQAHGGKALPPVRVPRPHQPAPEPKRATPTDLARLFGTPKGTP